MKKIFCLLLFTNVIIVASNAFAASQWTNAFPYRFQTWDINDQNYTSSYDYDFVDAYDSLDPELREKCNLDTIGFTESCSLYEFNNLTCSNLGKVTVIVIDYNTPFMPFNEWSYFNSFDYEGNSPRGWKDHSLVDVKGSVTTPQGTKHYYMEEKSDLYMDRMIPAYGDKGVSAALYDLGYNRHQISMNCK